MLTLVALRQGVAAAIAAALAADGWRESPVPYGQAGKREGAGRLDRSFAVGVPGTRAEPSRQKLSEGALVTSQVVIEWRMQLAALDQLTAYDTGLTQAAALRKAVLDITNMDFEFESETSAVDAEGWMSGELTFSVMHYLALN